MTINKVEVQDHNGNAYYPHTSSDVVKHGNTTVEKAINNKVGFGDNNAANPRINLFQDHNGNAYYPHTSSDVVKHGNTTVEKAINNKVGFGDNNAANPRINLFNKCGLDATASNNAGQGTAIRLKWDDKNYILVSDADARFFLKGLNALIID